MSNVWGSHVTLSIFGESHGKGVGIVLSGLPAGEHINMDRVLAEMARRAPGQDSFSTPRAEKDIPEIMSGLYQGKTTGSPICAVIVNENTRSKDYSALLRPGHADMTALLKYHGHADMRGGGHFSGRLTAGLVFAGSVAKQLLERRGIQIFGRIIQIGTITDKTIPTDSDSFSKLHQNRFPVCSQEVATEMLAAIQNAKDNHDSVGGVIEASAWGVPAGIGEPFFCSIESVTASMLFSVPAVKGVSFGDGFALSSMRGSASNDAITCENGMLKTTSNHNGGILGGITNGMPVIVNVAVKPTPSIGLAQQTVDASTMQQSVITVKGRHDPCIVPRAVPVIEAGLAISLLDCLAMGKEY